MKHMAKEKNILSSVIHQNYTGFQMTSIPCMQY